MFADVSTAFLGILPALMRLPADSIIYSSFPSILAHGQARDLSSLVLFNARITT